MIQLGTVTGQSIEPNRGTDINVRMLQVELGTTAQSDPQSVEYIGLSGDDNPPIDGDKVVVISIGPAFKIAIGVRDLIVTVMNPGERKLYSRDSSGDIAAYINFMAGGDIELNGNAYSAVRFEELQTAFNQLKADYEAHTGHFTPTNSAPPPSTADISPAESETVKIK